MVLVILHKPFLKATKISSKEKKGTRKRTSCHTHNIIRLVLKTWMIDNIFCIKNNVFTCVVSFHVRFIVTNLHKLLYYTDI